MSDISARRSLRTALAAYDASYPPDILGGGTDPHINTVTPATTAVNSGLSIATLRGRNFANDSVVEIDQAGVQSLFVSETEMQFETNLVALGVGTHGVTVRNVDTQESNTATLTITAAGPPSITTINPTTAPLSAGNVTVEVLGSGFDQTAIVTEDDQPVSDQGWFSPTRLQAFLDAGLHNAAGTYQIQVVNADLTESNSVPFTWTAGTATTEAEPTTETEPDEYEFPADEPEDA